MVNRLWLTVGAQGLAPLLAPVHRSMPYGHASRTEYNRKAKIKEN